MKLKRIIGIALILFTAPIIAIITSFFKGEHSILTAFLMGWIINAVIIFIILPFSMLIVYLLE